MVRVQVILFVHVNRFWRKKKKKASILALQRASWNIWQTSLLRQESITSGSSIVKLNSSSSRGKTALTWTCWGHHSITSTVRNLGVILDDGLSCTPNITAVAQSCRFALYNIGRILFFLTKDAMQLLVQALVISRLDYYNSLLAGLPASTTELLQRIQNAAAHLAFSLHIFSCDRLLHDLHWLPVLPIQDDGDGIQGCKQKYTHLPPNTDQTTCPSASISLHYISSYMDSYTTWRDLQTFSHHGVLNSCTNYNRDLYFIRHTPGSPTW